MVNAWLRDVDKHVVCESTNLAATNYARHIYNVKAANDIDNGKLVNLDDAELEENVYYTMVAPTNTSRVGLIISVPIGYDESPTRVTQPCYFYNAQNEIMRVYDLIRGDKFTISANGITPNDDEAGVQVGQWVVADGYDIVEVDEKPNGKTFWGEIVEKIVRMNDVFYKIVVRGND